MNVVDELRAQLDELRDRLLDGEIVATEVHALNDANGNPDAIVTTPQTELMRAYAAAYAMDMLVSCDRETDRIRALWRRYLIHVGHQFFPAVTQFAVEYMVQILIPRRDEWFAAEGLTVDMVEALTLRGTVGYFKHLLGMIETVAEN
ncbi:hypothetical protein SEA_MORGANA_96 [Gordonia phage Morgana]|uniref:Tail assembly chaperone n=1 Tax=Gordonia phage Morgana TaxID=3137292 RepID=A0AAX4RCY2_9CAUD